jgi:hypothetical protein
VVTISLKKVTAGSGYDYLIRQVTPPRRRRPEEEHLPSFSHDRDRGGPSIGF